MGTRHTSASIQLLERERSRVARELHTGAGQSLAALGMNLEVLEQWSSQPESPVPAEVSAALRRIRELTCAAQDEIRAVSHRLHPAAWQDLDIVTALRRMVDRSGLRRRCEVTLNIGPLETEPDQPARLALYRCAQECVGNTLRHSGATHFSLSLNRDSEKLIMSIRDNGKGLPSEPGPDRGIGLFSMEEYARDADGSVRVLDNSGGVEVEILLPFRGH